ncbi:MAG: hypothetical protein HUJ76_10220 [Parasporobacterium sp.]|nr:hypothetical protein [Parasporobacterium sp.]
MVRLIVIAAIRKKKGVMRMINDLIAVLSFALTCFALGYTIGRGTKK